MLGGRLPEGHRGLFWREGRVYSGWPLDILPLIEQSTVYAEALAAYRRDANPFHNPPHAHIKTVVRTFVCPSDSRASSAQTAPRSGYPVAFTCYLGVSGLDYASRDGILIQSQRFKLVEVSDGTSNTVMLGERPPSADFQFGWWYAGIGQRYSGSGDMILGVREQNLRPVVSGSTCGPGAYSFQPSRIDDPCGMFHFWSPHPGGANFAFADGAVRFLSYSAKPILPQLASRAGGEPVTLP